MNRVLIALTVAATVALSGCTLPAQSTTTRPTGTFSLGQSSADSAPTDSAPTTPTAAPAGSSVRDGKFEFRVTNMTRAATAGNPDNEFEIVKAQGEFIIVTMSVKNIGKEPQSYFADNQKLIDSSGRQYGASSEADTWENQSIGGDINPGNSIQVKAAFDVPRGTAPTELEVHDSMFSGGAKIDLS
jgi:hypothetical protein